MEEANLDKPSNCKFLLEDIFTLDTNTLEACDGIWMSYTLAYMEDPNYFILNWVKCLNTNGWFAAVDIDGLFSSHLSQNSKIINQIDLFEQQSALNKVYDFRVGRKIKNMMEQNGLEIIVAEDDWYDKELNFRGRAFQDIIETQGLEFELHKISLICSEQALAARLQYDVESGIRNHDVIERSIPRLVLYRSMDTKKIDVSDITAEQAAIEIKHIVTN